MLTHRDTSVSPWYNRNGWLGVKQQVTYTLACTHVCICADIHAHTLICICACSLILCVCVSHSPSLSPILVKCIFEQALSVSLSVCLSVSHSPPLNFKFLVLKKVLKSVFAGLWQVLVHMFACCWADHRVPPTPCFAVRGSGSGTWKFRWAGRKMTARLGFFHCQEESSGEWTCPHQNYVSLMMQGLMSGDVGLMYRGHVWLFEAGVLVYICACIWQLIVGMKLLLSLFS